MLRRVVGGCVLVVGKISWKILKLKRKVVKCVEKIQQK